MAKQGETAPVSSKDPQPSVVQTSWSSIVKSGHLLYRVLQLRQGNLFHQRVLHRDPPTKVEEHVSPVETTEAATPKAKSDAIPQVDQPKKEGQPKPPLTLASHTRELEFAPPSKPQKPLSQPPPEVATQEDDEDKAFQAAVFESLKAPSSPRPESGAQSSTPQPVVDLDQQESELIARMDRLMEESARFEALPNPTLRDRSRIRSVATVIDDIEQQIKEIGEQKRAQSTLKKPKVQDTRAPRVTTGVQLQESKASVAVEKVRPVAPPSTQPLTLDNLMANVTQPDPLALTAAISPEAQLMEIVGHDQPKAPSQAMPIEDRPQPPPPLITDQAQ